MLENRGEDLIFINDGIVEDRFYIKSKPQIREFNISKSGDVMIPQEKTQVLQLTIEQDVSSTVLIYRIFYPN